MAAGIVSYTTWPARASPSCAQAFSDAHTAVPRSVNTWAMQASFAEHGDWAGLKASSSRPTAAQRRQGGHRMTSRTSSGIGPKAAKALAAAHITTYRRARCRR